MYILFLSFIISICAAESSNIITGPNYHIVGRNLDVWNYPQGTAWDIKEGTYVINRNLS